MKSISRALGIGTLVLAISSVCACPTAEKQERLIETLVGQPISVHVIGGDKSADLSAVVRNEDGKYILCHAKDNRCYLRNLVHAAAIIESEIRDGDNESVEMKGVYNDDHIFEMYSVSANSYTIKLDFFK